MTNKVFVSAAVVVRVIRFNILATKMEVYFAPPPSCGPAGIKMRRRLAPFRIKTSEANCHSHANPIVQRNWPIGK